MEQSKWIDGAIQWNVGDEYGSECAGVDSDQRDGLSVELHDQFESGSVGSVCGWNKDRGHLCDDEQCELADSLSKKRAVKWGTYDRDQARRRSGRK